MSLLQLLSILRARFGWIVLCVVLSLGAVAGITFFVLTPVYTAVTSVVIAFKSSDPFERHGSTESMSPGYMATQIDIAKSHSVALKAVDALADQQQIAGALHGDTGEQARSNDLLAGRLRKNLDVRPARESRVVQFRYSASDPRFAAATADAFAQAYIDTQLRLNIDPARRSSVWLESQSKDLREEVERGQAKLNAYQQRHGITGGNDRLDLETQRMNELSAKLVTAQAQRYEAVSRELGENHPQYQSVIAQEESLRRLLAEQKGRVMQLRKQYHEMEMLQRDMESAQRAYDAAVQRHSQTSLTGQLDQTNVSILSRAVVPTEPSSPNVTLNLGVGAMLGLLLGFGAALLREIADRRVRSERDIEAELGLPVLGELLKGA